MSDEEDYNSEEDADYVPSDGELGSEEENSGEEEDLSVLADDAGTTAGTTKTRRKKQKKSDLPPRKRKGGIKLENEDGPPADKTSEDPANAELAQKLQEEAAAIKAEKEKKRAEDLWASFLSDVKPPAKPQPKSPETSAVGKQPSSSNSTPPPPTISTAKPVSKKVTITQVFDFAGEEIKVTKEVDAGSKEAQVELKKQEESEQQKSTASPSPSLVTSTPSTTSPAAGNSILGIKRPAAAAAGAGAGAGLSSILGKIGKKQKMGTLDKSKLDWENFKKKEGIEDDLKIHNKGKDGYIERMAFLNRADVRQFEIERELRLSKSGKR